MLKGIICSSIATLVSMLQRLVMALCTHYAHKIQHLFRWNCTRNSTNLMTISALFRFSTHHFIQCTLCYNFLCKSHRNHENFFGFRFFSSIYNPYHWLKDIENDNLYKILHLSVWIKIMSKTENSIRVCFSSLTTT